MTTQDKETTLRELEDEALRNATLPVTRSEVLELLAVLHLGDSLSVYRLNRSFRRRWGLET